MLFDFYNSSDKIISALEVCFFVKMLFQLYVFITFTHVLLEDISCILKCLTDTSNQKIKSRMIVFKLISTGLLSSVGFFQLNEYYIMVISGSFFQIPLVIIFPVFTFCYLYCIIKNMILHIVIFGFSGIHKSHINFCEIQNG